MTYTKKQFLEDVKKEAVALKKHATAEEIEKLDTDTLDPNDAHTCIYGQMTGDCASERAVTLIESCCVRYVHNCVDEIADEDSAFAMNEIAKSVNGERVDGFRENRREKEKDGYVTLIFLSPLETYIAAPFAKNANLIDFLKGNRKDLVL